MGSDSAKASSLSGLKVLVTRPKSQATGLANALKQVGAEAIRYPVLEIEALPENRQIKTTLNQLDQFKWVIFISTNAVRFAAQHLQTLNLALPAPTRCLAIGQATSTLLEQCFGTNALYPQSAADSESLLELTALQRDQIAGQKILIIRGEGGRETLKQQLQERGAEVQYLELYRRVSPTFSVQHPNPLPALLKEGSIDLLTVTSGQSLEYLTKLAEDQKSVLQALPLLVPSARVAELAKSSGFEKLLQSRGAGDAEVVDRLVLWSQQS